MIKQLRALFPDCTVAIRAATFNYLHHDAQAFERRTIPCVHIYVTSKEYHLDRNDRRIFHTPDSQQIVETLRAAGFCAEYDVTAPAGVSIIIGNELPLNIATGCGMWRNTLTQEARS